MKQLLNSKLECSGKSQVHGQREWELPDGTKPCKALVTWIDLMGKPWCRHHVNQSKESKERT